ncbi:MAG: EAL domain-containing protein [Candidatus Acididesulfobacter guangdongensis]|uniref:EAL domain-containing protein n=1 Tax=Acididesulfobacter guangdongensis TaxID=2597225 RepID=A0A519BES4_ACIG2|nr:MAG: EAL domain-containing protein [Candidatus Acididesulfobacter guangdongensis]
MQSENAKDVLKSFYKILADSAEAIYFCKDEKELFSDAAKAIVGCGLFTSVWIGAPGKDKVFKYFAAYGPGSEALKFIKIDISNTSEKQTLAASTWKDGKVHFSNERLNDPFFKPHLEFLKKFNWKSAATFPIYKDEKLNAVLAVVSDRTGLFTPETIGLIQRVVKLIETALNKFELHKERIKFDLYKKRALKEIKYAALHDTLTKLPNFELFEHNIKQLQTKAAKSKKSLCIAVLDVDNLQIINEKYGRQTGDDILFAISKKLLLFVKSNNERFKEHAGEQSSKEIIIPAPFIPCCPSRLGADEFGVVFLIEKESDIDILRFSIAELQKELSAPLYAQDNLVRFTISAGVSVCSGCADNLRLEPDTLIRMANQALYKSKSMGKNTINFFDTSEETGIIAYYKETKIIKDALASKEFILYYQPKVNIAAEIITGYEALIRRIDKDGNIISPAEFIPVAEKSDLIVDIGDYVMQAAIKQLEMWVGNGKEWMISVNVSARQLQKPDFLKKLKNALNRCPSVPAGLLQLEITETALLTDLIYTKEIMKECKDIGVTFAMDDFGSGYSSLIYFKELPFELVKIDMAFVRNMLESKDDMLMVQSIISLSEIFNKKVIAEGAETKEQCIVLNMLGCGYIQGYYTGRPIPAEKVIEWANNFRLEEDFKKWLSIRLDIADFSLALAYAEHSEWVKKIRKLCRGEEVSIEGEKIKNYKLCGLGLWYYGYGLKYKYLESYKKIEHEHIKLHDIAYKTMRLCIDGEYEKAQDLLNEIEKIQEKIKIYIMEIAFKIGKHSQ